jgi:hypothetical protein
MDPFQTSDNKQFLENMYQHTRYTNNIKKHQALTLFAQPSSNNFSLDLHEPLKIDKISDVYLDNFTTFDIGGDNNAGNAHKQFFILKIDQFDLKSISNKHGFNNAIIIPNDDTEGAESVKVHKGKKMNYVATLMPGTIDKITGTITDWAGDAIFQDSAITINNIPSTTGLTIIITASSTSAEISKITLTSDGTTKGTGAATNTSSGTFSGAGTTTEVATAIVDSITDISDLQPDGSTLGYSVSSNNNIITIAKSGTTTTVTLSGTYTTTADLSPAHPHFLAEFLIINRD